MHTSHHSGDAYRPWNGRAILHVDLDAFFAAVEQLDHPQWRGLPVIVGGDPKGRGVVSTASYEARRFGVRSAMPSARAALLCPDAIWAPSRFERYHEMSHQVFEIFRETVPLVQTVSVDEAFLDVTPGRFSGEHPVDIATTVRARIAALGITASAGLATSKTVAKIASDRDKPDALTVVWPGEEAEFLAPLPVRAMSGIGPQSASHLAALGVHTLGDLAALDDVTARSVLGSHGPQLSARARGDDMRQVHSRDSAKSVSHERTFPTDLRTLAEVDAALEWLAAKVGARLRAASRAGRTVTVKVRFSDFTTRSASRTLATPTDDERTFGPVASALVRSVWTPGVGVRLLGIGLSGFEAPARQLEITEEADRIDSGRIVDSLDAIRARFGDDAIAYGRVLRHPSDQGRDEPDET